LATSCTDGVMATCRILDTLQADPADRRHFTQPICRKGPTTEGLTL